MSSAIGQTLRRFFGDPDVAIDLGTANTRLYARGRGLIADQPSVVARHGSRHGSLPSRHAAPATQVFPLQAGVVTDVQAASELLRPIFHRARRFGLMRPRALACAPTSASPAEREALVEATRKAGAGRVSVTYEPLAAAVGAGLDISSGHARMLVDIGEGVTDIAVIRSNEIIASGAVRTACSDLHVAVTSMLVDRYGVSVERSEAERLTRWVGARRFRASPQLVRGLDCATGRERRVEVTSEVVADAVSPPIETIVGAVRSAVRDLPRETAHEVLAGGICLTGGGACLPGMLDKIALEVAIPVRRARDPMRAVINGARLMLAWSCIPGLLHH